MERHGYIRDILTTAGQAYSRRDPVKHLLQERLDQFCDFCYKGAVHGAVLWKHLKTEICGLSFEKGHPVLTALTLQV